jgi:hypothetical protein
MNLRLLNKCILCSEKCRFNMCNFVDCREFKKMMIDVGNIELFEKMLTKISHKKISIIFQYISNENLSTSKIPDKKRMIQYILQQHVFLEKKWILEMNPSECSVCMNSYCDHDYNYIMLDCNHDVCLKCCVNIYETSRKCPICRNEITYKYISENISKKEYAILKKMIFKTLQKDMGIIPVYPPPPTFITQPIAYMELNRDTIKCIPFIFVFTIIYLGMMYIYMSYPIIWLFSFMNISHNINDLIKIISCIVITCCISLYVYNYPSI